MSPLGVLAAAWTATTAATLSVLTVAYHVGAGRQHRALARQRVVADRRRATLHIVRP